MRKLQQLLLVLLVAVTLPAQTLNANDLNIGFNGPADQFPYAAQFYAATNAYYHSLGRRSMPGNRHCHAYLSWDIAEQTTGSGPIATEGSRAWFENWLAQAQSQCDEALITFKYVPGVTQSATATYPDTATYEAAMVAFLRTDWRYTGWRGRFDYTAWNEPNNGAGSGDGLSAPIPAAQAADFYLALRKHCLFPFCIVAAGDFGSNGNLWVDFVQNCPDDLTPTLCPTASYIDQYKHALAFDSHSFNLPPDLRPEVFSYHGWDDVNNYINASNPCTDPQRCTIRAFVSSLSHGRWQQAILWDTEVGAGQYTESNPDPTTQACAAAFLLRLTTTVTHRIDRLYYTDPDMTNGQYWSLFTSTGVPKPAFTVLADRQTTYTPPAGSTCP